MEISLRTILLRGIISKDDFREIIAKDDFLP